VLSDPDDKTVYTGRVVVLVDKFSASATEILAAALQDYERAVIVGTGPTHGKGTVQTFVDLDRLASNKSDDKLGVFKITIEQYFRVTGGSVQLRGVTPDVLLPDPNSYIESGERSLFHPIPWTTIDGVKFSPVRHTWVAADLQAASAARVKADAVFTKIEALGKVLKARRDDTTVPLERAAWQADRKQALAEAEANDPELAKQKPRLGVDLLDETEAATATTDKAVEKKLADWKDNLARDPWVDEAVHILGDMSGPTTKATTAKTK
jgi:carboxyl-terminal processing protease